jgi:hypothetical protein
VRRRAEEKEGGQQIEEGRMVEWLGYDRIEK